MFKRNSEEKKRFNVRLKTIEGQVRGIIGMIDSDRSCEDILIQIAAIDKSLKSVASNLLKEYLETKIKDDQNEEIDNIIKLFKIVE